MRSPTPSTFRSRPMQTALLLIDVQQSFAHRPYWTNDDAPAFLDRCNALVAGCAARRMIDVVFVVLPDTLLLDLAGPAEAFRLANQHLRQRGLAPAFRLRYAGPRADAATSVGATLAGLEPLPAAFERPTWVVLLG